MALPGRYDLTGEDPATGRGLYRGDTKSWSVEFFQDDGTTPITEDLSTGHTFLSEIRASPDASVVLATITVAATGANALSLTLPAAQAAQLTGSSGSWDLQVTRTSDGFVHTYLFGDVDILGDVSRA